MPDSGRSIVSIGMRVISSRSGVRWDTTKAFETAQELVRQLDEELQKNVSQDDPDNPIGAQNVEAGEAMQDFRDLDNKMDEKIDVSEMIAKLNADQKRVCH